MADPSGKSPSRAQEAPRRYYALFPPQGELLELYRRGELKAIIAFFQQEFAKAGFRHLAPTSFEVSLPRRDGASSATCPARATLPPARRRRTSARWRRATSTPHDCSSPTSSTIRVGA